MDPTFQCERDGQPTRDRQGENNAVLKPKQGKGPRGLEAHFDRVVREDLAEATLRLRPTLKKIQSLKDMTGKVSDTGNGPEKAQSCSLPGWDVEEGNQSILLSPTPTFLSV